ncbi:MAG: dTDP-4-dehydrorhamnose 3,5-epimerase [Flavobacteriales bacterium]|jgi:dTDP-4-dehydrorhamnose 3,5-epimerase|nr:dTDP-4-dehydrorhamnose 3,5-epimerase [Flavobacteriales bacterium]
MQIEHTPFEGLFIIKPAIFKDDRGYFLESYNKEKMQKHIQDDFVQDNESCSEKGVLRGLHFQTPPFGQSKLIRVIKGSILDVVVDLRKESKTYGQHFKIALNEDNKYQFYIPVGFAHGFVTLSDDTIINYKCSAFYKPSSEVSILWNDQTLNIDWGITNPTLSKKDLVGLNFSDFSSPF